MLPALVAIVGGYGHSLALRSTNQPPIAEAGPDQVIEATSAITCFTLDGSGSSDPSGDTLTCTREDGDSNYGVSCVTVTLRLSAETP